jgi:hypothetical protein
MVAVPMDAPLSATAGLDAVAVAVELGAGAVAYTKRPEGEHP